MLNACWWLINDLFISKIPGVYSNPFICALWNDSQCPSFTETGFPFWVYLVTLMVGGPVTSITVGFMVSIATGEWKKRGEHTAFFRRERYITAVVLLTTAPFMAIGYKLSLEGYYGQVYHGSSTVWQTVVQVVVFNFFADTWFYWTHRMFHAVEWLYKTSHFLHHSAHPVNTFMGNGGDFLELVTQGEMQIFFPPMFVPIQAGVFVLNALFMQLYVLFLHSGQRIRMPYHHFIVDPYEHNIHHFFGQNNYNFSLYFTFWDKIMGTHKATMVSWEKERMQSKSVNHTPSQTVQHHTPTPTPEQQHTTNQKSSDEASPPKTPAQLEQEQYSSFKHRTSGHESFVPLLYQTVLNCLDFKPVIYNIRNDISRLVYNTRSGVAELFDSWHLARHSAKRCD